MKLTAVFVQVPEGYIAFVEALPGANTQGSTLEAREDFQEAVALMFEANRELTEQGLVGQSVIREAFELYWFNLERRWPMSTEAGFLHAIQTDPNDVDSRLIYAD